MTERLQKILSARGVASRRKAEEMIQQGRVTCNGVICRLGQQADPDKDLIMIDGSPLPSADNRTYIMLYKPRGYVTTLSDEKGRHNAAELVSGCGKRVYPVGRLDMDSEGLLIFTDDGDFANHLMHPSHEVEKTYLVYVDGYTEDGLTMLRQCVDLDGYIIKKPVVHLLKCVDNRAKLSVTIHEGRNRQVRRMCALAGMKVERLIRVREGKLQLGNLTSGHWRYLENHEVEMLRE